MGRGKERCPKCGSKKVLIEERTKKCNVCHHEWRGKERKKYSRKDKEWF